MVRQLNNSLQCCGAEIGTWQLSIWALQRCSDQRSESHEAPRLQLWVKSEAAHRPPGTKAPTQELGAAPVCSGGGALSSPLQDSVETWPQL